jgi:hypothetical protein
LLERFKTMSKDEQTQFIARLKDRGSDVSPFESAMKKAPAPSAKVAKGPTGETIDALFAPLPVIETRGRVWLYTSNKETASKELKVVNLRLGITDGTVTELLGGDLQPGTEVVTGISTGNARATAGAAGAGNPLLPNQGRGGGPGGFGGGGGGRGR